MTQALRLTPSLMDQSLLERLQTTPRVLVVGRNSGSGGRAPRNFAATDIRQAVERLALQGVDVIAALPSHEELVEMLRSAETVSSVSSNNKVLKRSCVTIDRLNSHGALFLLLNGSAVSVDDHGLQQMAEVISQTIWDNQPLGLVYSKRLDRMSRNIFSIGRFAEMARTCGAFIGDETTFWDPSKFADQLTMIINAGVGEQHARTMARTMPKAMTTHTGTSMAAGQVKYGFGQHAPPGLFRYRLREGNYKGRSYLCFDDPLFHPDSDTVAYGMPQILDFEVVC